MCRACKEQQKSILMIERRRMGGLVLFSASFLKDILLSVHRGFFFCSGWRMFYVWRCIASRLAALLEVG